MLNEKELKEKLAKLLNQAGIKPRSKQAALLEFGFLQGYIFADEKNAHPYLLILMMSGRSLLDP